MSLQIERHIQNSNPEPLIDLEPASKKAGRRTDRPSSRAQEGRGNRLPAGHGARRLSRHRRLLPEAGFRTGATFSPPRASCDPRSASVRAPGRRRRPSWARRPRRSSIAAILQRGNAITSAGGYLRELTRKAQANAFSLGPMLMALISARQGAPKATKSTACLQASNSGCSIERISERPGLWSGSCDLGDPVTFRAAFEDAAETNSARPEWAPSQSDDLDIPCYLDYESFQPKRRLSWRRATLRSTRERQLRSPGRRPTTSPPF